MYMRAFTLADIDIALLHSFYLEFSILYSSDKVNKKI